MCSIGSPDSIQLSSSGRTTNGGPIRNGMSNHITTQYWRDHDSGSSSLSNSHDASFNSSHFEYVFVTYTSSVETFNLRSSSNSA